MPNSACSADVIWRRFSLDVGDEQHVGAVGIEIEPVGDILAQHRRRERPETLAVLDLEVEVLLHRGRARIAEDRARAERARAELHAALEPADGLFVGQRLRGRLDHRGFVEHREFRAGRGQPALDLFLRIMRAEIGAGHAVGAIASVRGWPLKR